ncbi:MAG: M20/M25/M40 family metallo-hydrolase [Chloroflexota bacterium]|nr:M20/M25/M40 family metallo-hydrolase [Chloroflexota bacterium]
MDYVKVARELLAFDTSVPPGLRYEEVMDYLKPVFSQVGFETETVHIPREYSDGNEPRVNLLAHRRQPGKPRLIFYAHIDVVPAQGWEAFQPRVENGRIYARGAADMKGGLVALLLGLDKVKGKTLKYDTSVMVTTDEEVGQSDQLRYLGRFLEPLAGAYLFDLDSSFGYVVIASLGAIQMDIKVKGTAVHSAMAHTGENAVEKANLLINALLDLKREVVKRKSKVDAHPSTGLARMEARLNINVVKGGLKVNIVPDECLISVDRRLIPEENLVEAERELVKTLSGVPGVRWEIDKVFRIPTVPPLSADPVTDELAGIIRQVTGKSGKFGEMGSGDLGHIAALDWKARHFGAGVIRPDCNIHGKDEFVNQKDIEDLALIIARFVAS